jgi:hypothetical protein
MAKVTAFEVFYKRLGPTGSNWTGQGGTSTRVTAGFISKSWWTASVVTGNVRVSSSYVNYPNDPSSTIRYVSTRNEASMSGYIALPWSSPVCDFLWNCQNISWSYIDSSSAYVTNSASQTKTETRWTMAQNTNVGFYKEASNSPYGVSRYPITSSWHIVDPQVLGDPDSIIQAGVNYPTGSVFFYTSFDSNVGGNTFPVAIGSNPDPDAIQYWINGAFGENLPPWGLGYTVKSGNPAYDDTISVFEQPWLAPSSLEYFDKGICVGINRGQVRDSQSDIAIQYNESINYFTTEYGWDPTDPAAISGLQATYAIELNTINTSLKKRRLYYPTRVSGSGTPGGTDYWHKLYTGYRAVDMFQDNGGIYNVQFTLKRYAARGEYDSQLYAPYDYDYLPDPGSCLKVFIANVDKDLSGSLVLQTGATDPNVYPHTMLNDPITYGIYPPDNNVVICGHGFNGPLMSFYDIRTKTRTEKFSINLIQYGFPAQLCFEPCVVDSSGNTFPLSASEVVNNSNYFACMIDDISVCKIGMTTDTRFVQPLTVAQQTQAATTSSIVFKGFNLEEIPFDLGF